VIRTHQRIFTNNDVPQIVLRMSVQRRRLLLSHTGGSTRAWCNCVTGC